MSVAVWDQFPLTHVCATNERCSLEAMPIYMYMLRMSELGIMPSYALPRSVVVWEQYPAMRYHCTLQFAMHCHLTLQFGTKSQLYATNEYCRLGPMLSYALLMSDAVYDQCPARRYNERCRLGQMYSYALPINVTVWDQWPAICYQWALRFGTSAHNLLYALPMSVVVLDQCQSATNECCFNATTQTICK